MTMQRLLARCYRHRKNSVEIPHINFFKVNASWYSVQGNDESVSDYAPLQSEYVTRSPLRKGQ